MIDNNTRQHLDLADRLVEHGQKPVESRPHSVMVDGAMERVLVPEKADPMESLLAVCNAATDHRPNEPWLCEDDLTEGGLMNEDEAKFITTFGPPAVRELLEWVAEARTFLYGDPLAGELDAIIERLRP